MHPEGAQFQGRNHYTVVPAPWVAGCSDIGTRHRTNQDALCVAASSRPTKRAVLVVSDGVSTALGAEHASLVAVEEACSVLIQAVSADGAAEAESFNSAFTRAHEAVLAAGADDYVTKPFSMEEVMIRLHRLVQRSGVAAVDDAELVVGDLILNQDTREVSRGGDPITLTATQFDLLRYLMENAKRVVSKSQILDNVWNYDFGGQANIVELYISYLRKKIDVGREPMIHTVRGAGYVIRPAV